MSTSQSTDINQLTKELVYSAAQVGTAQLHGVPDAAYILAVISYCVDPVDPDSPFNHLTDISFKLTLFAKDSACHWLSV